MKNTSEQLAKSIGAVLEGEPGLELSGVASPERAGPHDLIFVESHQHATRARDSLALCVIAGHGIVLGGKTILRAAHPKLAFAKAAEILLSRPPIAIGLHPTAIVAPGVLLAEKVSVGAYAVIGDEVHIGAGTQIGAHTIIGPGCRIGENCRLHPRVTLYAGVRIGNQTEIHSGAVVGADGFGYASGEGRYWKFPQTGIVEIGDQVEIGANATIDRGSLDNTRIAEGVKIDNLVHIGHNCQIGAHTVIAAQAGLSGSCRFGEHVTVGGQAGFGERCQVQDGALIGGQSGVLGGKIIRGTVPVWGTPARSLAKFKEQFAWLGKLAQLAERIKRLETKLGSR